MNPCEICGVPHRYSYPDGSDRDGHEWSATACANTVDGLRRTRRVLCPTCNGNGVIVEARDAAQA